jgi:predicted AlkP superfamily pyrophosphatase or phosphodiesterase
MNRMRNLRLLRAFFFCTAMLLSAAVHSATNHHVVLITIDGLAAYYLEDATAPLPTLRKLAREGASAAGMKVSNPSITWPNHTTLVTGVHPEKHSVLFNGLLVRPGPGLGVRVDPKREKVQLVSGPTVYDVLHRNGYRTAGINWPCTRNSRTLDDDFPDVPDSITHTTPKLRDELIELGILKDSNNTNFTAQSAASRDQIWTAAAAHVIRTRKPNFMLFHMLVTDGLQHRYGPRSPAAYAALAQADAQLRDILGALDQAGIREQTTLFVVADHGFEAVTNIIHPNVLLRKQGWLETNVVTIDPPTFKAKAQIVSEGGTALVYLTDPQTKREDLDKVRQLFRDMTGIAEILEPTSFAALGYPSPEKNMQMADFVLVPSPGHAFDNLASGDEEITPVTLTSGSPGSHGYLSTNPRMNAAFVAAGRGIKRGARLDTIDNRDVAPTIAHLLGQKLPRAEGKVLTGILD